MVDQIKDFLYDISDIVLSILIVVMIFAVISWKLSDSMDFNKFSPDPASPSVTNTSNTPADENTNTVPVEVVAVTTPETTPTTQTPSTTEVTSAVITVDTKIEVKSGASGYSIAKDLKAKGLISNTSDFIKRVEELKAGSKLRMGSFTIKAGSSLDDIIKTLTGE